jgi:chromosome segregation ATPase
MLDAQRSLEGKEAELAKMIGELDERSSEAEAHKVDIITLKTQVETFKDRLADAGRELKTIEERRDAERVELHAATQELAAERGKVENLGRRVSELEQALVAQTTEAQILGRRAQDLENRLGDQSKALNESEFELKQVRGQIEVARKTEADLRAAIAELDGRTSQATQQLRAENAQLLAEIERTKGERDRMAADLGAMKRETEENWASERVENALLRERINDVAAEVARLASTLEGPDSPIDAILAAETARDRVSSGIVASNTNVEMVEAPAAGGNLADRIRALQHASRTHNDDPKTHN